ncbi:DUF4177 domain-containing protein [Clostridium ganghwense]|uniref:DUF4177 domain-containing protein n=1 Tax=Clostridium ganghwense TaxID=312089 RepID=A0ABT4CWT8_9CLOT|nr:DUF4177 domain-containing protein [Clostridium ganghwense]MCY6372496.1 DUF4177 domain-containing protein [Clostridium ganghwense]
MYEYKFEKIEMKSGLLRVKPEEDYHKIIEKYAAEGWRLIQIFAPAISGYGSAPYYELIFEKQK